MMAQQPNFRSSDGGDDEPRPTTARPKVTVYDRLPPPPPPTDPAYATDRARYYLLGLGHRGQAALRHFRVWGEVEAASVAVLGRRDWKPGKTAEEDGVVRMADKAVTSRVLPRDKLVSVLKGVIEARYGDVVELRYGYQVDPVSFGNDTDGPEAAPGPPVELTVSRCIPIVSSSSDDGEECSVDGDDAFPTTVTTDFLIGTDGAARTIANAMEAREHRGRPRPKKGAGRPFRVTRYRDDNQRVYKSVPISFPSHWPHNLNYSARSTGGRATLEALPADAAGNYCALLLLKPGDPLAAGNGDAAALRDFFRAEFPQFSNLIGDDVLGDVARKSASALPGFRYVGPRLHEGGRTVLLGDCVHTVKPYFGLGANTALEDVQILSNILSATPDLSQNLHRAVAQFTQQRAADSRALVTLSRGMDRPGKIGTLRFVVPLIVDAAFHRAAPGIFAPGMFRMFQKEGVGFRRIQLRKRLDRVTQSLAILGGASVAFVGARSLVRNVARMLGVKDAFVGGGMIALLGVAGVVRRIVAGEK